MKSIIRFEHPEDGKGIFCHLDNKGNRDTVYDFLESVADRHIQFPNLRDDFDMYDKYEEWFCAYKSIEQVNEWITPEEVKVIIEKGFIILLLDVTEYRESDFQIIFKKHSITEKKDITFMFDLKIPAEKTQIN